MPLSMVTLFGLTLNFGAMFMGNRHYLMKCKILCKEGCLDSSLGVCVILEMRPLCATQETDELWKLVTQKVSTSTSLYSHSKKWTNLLPLYDQGDNHKPLNNILFKVCPSQTFIYKDGHSDFYCFKCLPWSQWCSMLCTGNWNYPSSWTMNKGTQG